jgi:hypothetical protein
MMHAEKGLEKLGDFLANPNHIIISSTGKFNLIFFRPTCFSITTHGLKKESEVAITIFSQAMGGN